MSEKITGKMLVAFAIGFVFSTIITARLIFKLEPRLTLEILQFSSILIALTTFVYTRKKDEKSEVANQIAFFRKEVIPLEDDFLLAQRNLGIDRLKLSFKTEIFTEVVTSEEILSVAKRQYQDSDKVFSGSKKMYEKHINVLNLLEEFSLRVKHYQTQDHAALNSLYTVFVDSTEHHTTILFFVREIDQGSKAYSHILWLYFLWKERVDTSNAKQRIKKSETWKKIIWS